MYWSGAEKKLFQEVCNNTYCTINDYLPGTEAGCHTHTFMNL